ncbi:uncharacterized protein LOC131192795 isoform X2 [Ahaetulla prasina]|uniref:uncharacterized protein LOC131192795 isoform X2 n=1 Tax=Ahaetulla prasina TaxID=499056 RepID=UPI002647856F|nr:uncharacterized protein LOC131192795 isoform X2 [Ahaetulla prasina]
MAFPGVPLMLLVGALARIPGSEAGKETPAHFLYQAKSECRFLNGTQRVRYLGRWFYDRQEFVRFDSDLRKYVAVTEFGKVAADASNRNKVYLQIAKAQVDYFCRYNYEVYSYQAHKAEERLIGRRVSLLCLLLLLPSSQAHRHHLPHQDGPHFPQHHPPLHRDGLLPRGDQDPVVEEWAAGEGGCGLWGGAPERRLDLPAPGDAGDPAPVGGPLHLQGGACQPGGSHHRPVGAPFLQLCQEQTLDGDHGGRDRSGLPGCGALLLPEEQESNSHPTTCSTHELILLSDAKGYFFL